jgi:hypothetical protein
MKKFPTFYGTQLSTCPYFEPDKSCPCPSLHFRKIYFLTFIQLRPGLPSGVFVPVFRTRSCVHLSAVPYVLHTQAIFDVVEFTSPTKLSLLSSRKLLFPNVGLKISFLPSSAWKSPKIITFGTSETVLNMVTNYIESCLVCNQLPSTYAN